MITIKINKKLDEVKVDPRKHPIFKDLAKIYKDNQEFLKKGANLAPVVTKLKQIFDAKYRDFWGAKGADFDNFLMLLQFVLVKAEKSNYKLIQKKDEYWNFIKSIKIALQETGLRDGLI